MFSKALNYISSPTFFWYRTLWNFLLGLLTLCHYDFGLLRSHFHSSLQSFEFSSWFLPVPNFLSVVCCLISINFYTFCDLFCCWYPSLVQGFRYSAGCDFFFPKFVELALCLNMWSVLKKFPWVQKKEIYF